VLGSYDSAVELIGETFLTPITTVAIPAGRLDPAFFVLSTGVAGEFVQKFVNYKRRLAIVGDISAQVAASDALRDWIYESNRRSDLWFVTDLAQLEDRLATLAG
jgi:hypothetical protein